MATTTSKKTNDDPAADVSTETDAGKEAALAAYNNLLEAGEHFRKAAQAAGIELKEEAGEQLHKGREKAAELGQQANDYIQQKPLASLGIAFAAGFLIAQLFGRR